MPPSNMSIQPGYPGQGLPMDPANHPAAGVPAATDSHSGTELPAEYSNKALKDRQYGSMNRRGRLNQGGAALGYDE